MRTDASSPARALRPQPTLLRRLSLTAAALDGPSSVFARLRAAVDARRSDVAALLDATLTAARGSDDARATLLPHVLRDALTAVAGPGPHPDGGALEELLNVCQEAVVVSPCVGIALRPTAGRWVYVRLCSATLRCDELTTAEYLGMKETLAGQHLTPKEQALGVFEIDLSPFARGVPFLTRPQSIGSGALFLNRHLATALTAPGGPGPAPLYDYLSQLTLDGTPVMINGRIASAAALPHALARALGWLAAQPPDTPWVELADRLQEMGFEPGWGTTAATVSGTMDLLSDVLEAADPDRLADFLARVPSITRVALISPHGFFAQANALGKPDTGGQVVYILDQTRALEAEMAARLAAAGVAAVPRIVILTRLIPDAGNTTCDVRLEKVAGTEHAVILRVPFRNGGGVVRKWISRFDVWPYLEGFAVDAAADLSAELGGPPQLIVGNYSDGNLVASLLANHFDAPHFSIAHALEKSKYRQLWRWNAPQHAAMHADVQITADLLAMARADCIITSTFQEIAGKSVSVTAGDLESAGQYEQFNAFTLPGLYRVTNGISIYDPRFNIISPGADASVYFPYDAADRRITSLQPGIEDMIFGEEQAPLARGTVDRGKPILFAIGRNDSIKNMVGLANLFADCPRLQRHAILVIVAGSVVVEDAPDDDGAACARALHALFDTGRLPPGTARWIRAQANPVRNGELYRMVADTRGAFAMPSLYEAFGLVTIEAMSTGLPSFVSIHGGGAEIVKDSVNGFHIDPFHPAAAAEKMADFFEAAAANEKVWLTISKAARDRVAARYNWPLFAHRMLSLAKVSTFYRASAGDAAKPRRAYQAALFHLLLRPLMARVPTEEDKAKLKAGGCSAVKSGVGIGATLNGAFNGGGKAGEEGGGGACASCGK